VSTVSLMRPRGVAAIAFGSALVGAVAVLLCAWAGGWLRGERSAVVIRETADASPAAISRVLPAVAGRFDPAAIYAGRGAGVVTIFSVFESGRDATVSQGSGFVVSSSGVILTNSHVITTAGGTGAVVPAVRVYVEFKDRDRVAARVVGWDVFDDVGVIRIDPSAHPLRPLALGDSSRVVVGEPVAAIGSPFGNENSLTVGVVSATRRSVESLTSDYNLVDAIQIDAPINHGDSGGPLFDAQGRVIGINAQIRSDSGNAEGVGFAVPIDAARRSMEQLLVSGKVAYAYIGITTEDLSGALRSRDHLDPAGQPGRCGRAARRLGSARLQRRGVHVRRRRARRRRRAAGPERERRRPGRDHTAPARAALDGDDCACRPPNHAGHRPGQPPGEAGRRPLTARLEFRQRRSPHELANRCGGIYEGNRRVRPPGSVESVTFCSRR
jgi:S1-C subfamily serine protease